MSKRRVFSREFKIEVVQYGSHGRLHLLKAMVPGGQSPFVSGISTAVLLNYRRPGDFPDCLLFTSTTNRIASPVCGSLLLSVGTVMQDTIAAHLRVIEDESLVAGNQDVVVEVVGPPLVLALGALSPSHWTVVDELAVAFFQVDARQEGQSAVRACHIPHIRYSPY